MDRNRFLNLRDRKKIKELLDKERNINQIADALGRNYSTICRELNRFEFHVDYDPKKADEMAKRNMGYKQPRKDLADELNNLRMEVSELTRIVKALRDDLGYSEPSQHDGLF